MYLNKATIIGNLTRNPELKTLPSGVKITSFSVATNRTWKDKNGAKKEGVDYHNIVVYGRQAETSSQYLKKGSQCLIEGRLQTHSWDDAGTGKKMYRTEIIASQVQFGSRPSGQNQQVSRSPQGPTNEEEQEMKNLVEGENDIDIIEYPEEDISPEDIPF